MKTYIKKTNKKTNEELYFMGFIPLGAFGEAEHWIPSIHQIEFNEASDIFIKLTSASDGKYRYQLYTH
jgi:hypothetical protein